MFDIFTKRTWCIPLKKYGQTLTDEISNFLTASKRKPIKMASDRGTEYSNSVFQNLLNLNNMIQYSRFSDEGPVVAERVITTFHIFLKQPAFEKRKRMMDN